MYEKTVGALSIFTLILQTSGPFLPFYLFFVPPGTSLAEKVTYMTHGTLQTTLLVLCVVWHYRNKRLGIDDLVIPKDDLNVPGDEDVIDERARLLR